MEGLPGHPVRGPRRGASRGSFRVERQLRGARRLVLLRHGRTADNAAGRIQGQLDTPLDGHGRAQAEAAAPVLAASRPCLLLSSDLTRAASTAVPLARATGLAVTYDKRLRELDLGAWQGLTADEARDRFPDEHTAWRAGQDVARGGGETYREAGERAVQCLLEHLPSVPADGTLVAVTHGGTARATIGLLLELPGVTWGKLAPLDNAHWSVLVDHRLGWRLEQHGVGPHPPVAEPVPPVPEAEARPL